MSCTLSHAQNILPTVTTKATPSGKGARCTSGVQNIRYRHNLEPRRYCLLKGEKFGPGLLLVAKFEGLVDEVRVEGDVHGGPTRWLIWDVTLHTNKEPVSQRVTGRVELGAARNNATHLVGIDLCCA